MAVRIRVRRDTAANWTSADPTLAQSEIGHETDTNRIKIGDGSTPWTSLDYFGEGGAVDSVFGRTGTVVAEASDYDASQVDNDSGVTGATVAAALDQLDSDKADTGHDHDDLYYTESEVDAALGDKADASHTHDDRYYTETEVDTALAELAPGIVSISTNTTLSSSHANKTLRVTGSVTITLPTGLDDAFQCQIMNVGSGVVDFAKEGGVSTNPDDLPDLDNSTGKEITTAYVQHAGSDEFDVVAESLEAVTLGFALSDEDSDLEVGTDVLRFRMPFPVEVSDVRFTVNTAPTGDDLQFDINVDGSSVLSTKATIDAGDFSTATAATQPVLSEASWGNDELVAVDIDQIGSTEPGAGAKLWIYGYRTG